VISTWKGDNFTVKKNILWLFVVLSLVTLAVPTSLMADGNPMPSCTSGKCTLSSPGNPGN
jgi:hypothetical protein